MSAIDEILELLRDGKWHEVKEVAEKTGLHEFKVKLVTSFLAEYDFVLQDSVRNRVKLTSQLLNFLKKIQDLEEKEAVRSLAFFG